MAHTHRPPHPHLPSPLHPPPPLLPRQTNPSTIHRLPPLQTVLLARRSPQRVIPIRRRSEEKTRVGYVCVAEGVGERLGDGEGEEVGA